MKSVARIVLTAVLLAGAAVAQEGQGAEGEGSLQLWKWANFALLAGAIIYFVAKSAPAFFAARSLSIRKEIIEANEARKEAEARAAAVEARLANLGAEIAALRAEAQDEGRAETKRITQHTAEEIAKIQAHAEQEIAAAGKTARLELKRYAAGLAVQLAQQKIQARMTPATQDALVRGFVRDLQ
jgi:F-type H+-transporting ATPase subunit b